MSNITVTVATRSVLTNKNRYLKSCPDDKELGNKTSAFAVFKNDNSNKAKNTLKARGLKASGPELARVMSGLWAAASDEVKTACETAANANREALQIKIRAWKKAAGRKRPAVHLPPGWTCVPSADKEAIKTYYEHEKLGVITFAKPYATTEGLGRINKRVKA